MQMQDIVEPAWSLALREPIENTVNYAIATKCPHCGDEIYFYWHTPCTDDPLLGRWYLECTHCDWEDDDSYATLQDLNKDFELRATQP